ncbi:MAG: folate-binding protein [Propionibacteriaceae bacterium]|jgi:folate-binding protein YgfZ|nr:folate-binding protein [Propionibacteriaceae bacterium]
MPSEVTLASGPDAGAVWHYGEPIREQRAIVNGTAGVDLGHLPVLAIAGPDRLGWLNNLTTQQLANIAPGKLVRAYLLNPQGHVLYELAGVDDGGVFRASTEPDQAQALLNHLAKMRWRSKVEITDVSADFTLIVPAGAPEPNIVPRAAAEALLGVERAGLWAYEALRIASGRPRAFLDFDANTLPNELANPEGDHLGAHVHLRKGCYPGQETVAKVFNIGKPPRRLTLLHLDGSEDALPEVGADVLFEGEAVGRMGTSERHYELGPVGLALLKRDLPLEAQIEVGGIAAAQQKIVDPDAGLHVRPEVGKRSPRSLI